MPRKSVEHAIRKQAETAIRTYLKRMKKDELADWLMQFAHQSDEMWEQLERECGFEPQLDSAADQIDAARLAIEEATQVGLEYGGDYHKVRQRLKSLIAAGQADAVLELGRELFARGQRQVELSDEGLMADDLDGCLAVVFAALPASSLSQPEQMAWAWDLAGQDDYNICDETSGRFWKQKFSKAAWGDFADVLLEQLAVLDAPPPAPKGRRRRSAALSTDDFERRYRRKRLVDRLNAALRAAGRGSEARAP